MTIVTEWFYKSPRHFKQVEITTNELPTCYNSAFTDIDLGVLKHLECRVNGFSFTFAENTNLPLHIPFQEPNYNEIKIHIVYFANTIVNPVFGTTLICMNLKHLIQSEILYRVEHCTVHLMLSVHNDSVKDTILNMIPTQLQSKFIFHISYENAHEYPGILKVYELGLNTDTDDIILYFHSKNITRFKGRPGHPEEHVGHKLMNDIIMNWRYCLFVFTNFPSIDKIGAKCNQEGFVWFNYWWVRSSYIKDMECPLKTTNRYYYESWLARQYKGSKDKVKNCWSVSSIPHKNFFNVGSIYEPPGVFEFI